MAQSRASHQAAVKEYSQRVAELEEASRAQRRAGAASLQDAHTRIAELEGLLVAARATAASSGEAALDEAYARIGGLEEQLVAVRHEGTSALLESEGRLQELEQMLAAAAARRQGANDSNAVNALLEEQVRAGALGRLWARQFLNFILTYLCLMPIVLLHLERSLGDVTSPSAWDHL